MGTFFELEKDKAAKGEGWAQLYPRYSGSVIPIAPWKPLPLCHFH